MLLTLSLLSCEGAPKFPELDFQYWLEVTESKIICHKEEIISEEPYLVKPVGVVPITECNNITGIKTSKLSRVLVWKDKTLSWAK
jgi:hypothetical protein